MPAHKRIVFISHPVRGDVEGNMRKILDICRSVHKNDLVPVAPYLVSLQYLNDEIVEDRELGMESSAEFFKRGFVDEMWLFGDRITAGMKAEIELARKHKIPVVPKTPATSRALVRLLRRERNPAWVRAGVSKRQHKIHLIA